MGRVCSASHIVLCRALKLQCCVGLCRMQHGNGESFPGIQLCAKPAGCHKGHSPLRYLAGSCGSGVCGGRAPDRAVCLACKSCSGLPDLLLYSMERIRRATKGPCRAGKNFVHLTGNLRGLTVKLKYRTGYPGVSAHMRRVEWWVATALAGYCRSWGSTVFP